MDVALRAGGPSGPLRRDSVAAIKIPPFSTAVDRETHCAPCYLSEACYLGRVTQYHSNHALEKRFRGNARSLQDAFFLEQDKILIEKLRAMKKMAENKQSLAEISASPTTSSSPASWSFEIAPKSWRRSPTVPLIDVAWADGTIDEQERGGARPR